VSGSFRHGLRPASPVGSAAGGAEWRCAEQLLPSSVGLSDQEEPSPSQYRVEKVREDATDPLEGEEEVPEYLINSDEDNIDHTDPPPCDL
jgi:hypothetical protein